MLSFPTSAPPGAADAGTSSSSLSMLSEKPAVILVVALATRCCAMHLLHLGIVLELLQVACGMPSQDPFEKPLKDGIVVSFGCRELSARPLHVRLEAAGPSHHLWTSQPLQLSSARLYRCGLQVNHLQICKGCSHVCEQLPPQDLNL